MKSFKNYLAESKVHKHADHFVDYCCGELDIKDKPEIIFVDSKAHAKKNTSFGGYYPGLKKIKVNVAGRHVVDVLRTLAHELVHHKQNEDERLDINSGKTGSDIENEANSKAGIILRNYGKAKPELFESMNEVFLNDIKDKDTVIRQGGLGSDALGKEPPRGATKIGKLTNGDHVWHKKEPGGAGMKAHLYYVTDPETNKVNIHLQTHKYGDEHGETVGSVVSNHDSKGVHKLYQHLVVKHNKILVGDDQSEGARKVWAKAARHPSVHVHGFEDTQQGKAVHGSSQDDDLYVKPGHRDRIRQDQLTAPMSDKGDYEGDRKDQNRAAMTVLVMHKK